MKWKPISEFNITSRDPYGTIQYLFRLKNRQGVIKYVLGYVHKGVVYTMYNSQICLITELPDALETVHFINPREISM